MPDDSVSMSPTVSDIPEALPEPLRRPPVSRASKPTDFQLVGPDEVENCLAVSAPDFVLLEAHFSSIDHPLDPDRSPRRHLPGAIQVHPSYLEAGANDEKYYPFYDTPADGNLLEERELIVVLERLGIEPDSHVVIYGTEPDGTMAAARLVWGLMYAGVEKIRLLDGGIDAWVEHGGATSSHVRTVWDFEESPVTAFRRTSRWHQRPEYLATTTEVREVVQQQASNRTSLIDVRRRGEWDGTLTDYYCFFSEAGHIPTAIHQGDWDNLLEAETHKLEPRLREVAARWRQLGIVERHAEQQETTLIFYCGTGWRSSIAFLVAHLLGLRAKNYDDGFYGWSSEDSTDVFQGDS